MGGRGKGRSMGSKRKRQKCALKEQGKGGSSKQRGKSGSSKSKTSKGFTSNNCTDYEFSPESRQRKQENSTQTTYKSRNEINNILHVARGIPTLSIFVDLVERTKLAAILDDCSGPFTALLPSNRAF